MTSFAAIDFETLNQSHGSIWEIGYAIVDDGRIQESAGLSVRPCELRFGAWQKANLEVTPEDLINCPRFSAIWPDVESLIGERVVFAHSAGSDASMARQTAEANGMDCPSIELACSRDLARAVWPDLPEYGLSFLASRFGIEIDHHRAESDARASAELVMLALDKAEETDPIRLLEKHGLAPRPIANYAGHASDSVGGVRGPRGEAVEVRALEGFDTTTHPFHGKVILITGAIHGMTRDQALEAVQSVGGIPKQKKSWSREVNILIEGVQTNLKPGEKHSGKMKKALAARDKGHDVEIYTQAEFKELLSFGTNYGG